MYNEIVSRSGNPIEKKKPVITRKADWFEDVSSKAKDFTDVGTGSLAGSAIGGIIGAFFGLGGAWAGVRLGGVAGGIIAALVKTSPSVISVSANSKDTIAQLQDLAKATQSSSENGFIVQFISELEALSITADEYANEISKLAAKKADTNASEAHDITAKFLEQIDKVKGTIKQFEQKDQAGIYKQFVSHSKILTPVYWFMLDDLEDVEKSIMSLSLAIKQATFDIDKVKQIAQTSGQSPQPKQTQEENKTTNELKMPEQSSGGVFDTIFKNLGVEPNEARTRFLQSIIGK